MSHEQLVNEVNHVMRLAYSPDPNDADMFINAFLSADPETQDIVVSLIGADVKEETVLH